jgi:hypothetical protein
MEVKDMDIFEIGEVVRFTADQMWDGEIIALEGMIGVVQDGAYVCTPGISAMIRAIGANWQFGFPCEVLERVESEPTEEEIEKSHFLNENRFEIFHKRYGWTGLLKIKGKVKTEEQSRKEISQLCEKLRVENSAGHLKRLARVLKAFKYHRDEQLLFQFADELKGSEILVEVLSKIEAWNKLSEIGESVPVNRSNELWKRAYDAKRDVIELGAESGS